jgi:4-coumarate--CoA ligase
VSKVSLLIPLLTVTDSEYALAPADTVLHAEAANPQNKITKAQLHDLLERIAHGLRNNYSIGATGPNKDVVTVISYGQILLPAAFYGIIAAGGVYSAASPSSTVSELARQITLGNSNLIICDTEHVDVVSKAAAQSNVPRMNILVLNSSPWSLKSLEGGIDAISNERLTWQRITDPKELKESLVVVLWSSGTTGLPKGVMISHLNLVAELHILALPGTMRMLAQIKNDEFVPPVEYRSLVHLPTSHIAGLFGYFVATLFAGGTAYWMRKYNWADLLKYARKYKITSFYTVPSIYLRISKAPEVTDQFSHLEGASTGAAPMDDRLQQAANRRLGTGKQPSK